MSRRGRGGILGSRQLLVGSRRRRVRLGTRSGRSRFNGVPGRAMEQVKGEGRPKAPGLLGHRLRPGRGWRSGAGRAPVGAAVWGRPSSGRGEGVRAAAHRAGGEQCSEAGRGQRRVHSAPAGSVRRAGGPATVRPTSGPRREERPWPGPEASREVALGSAEGAGGTCWGRWEGWRWARRLGRGVRGTASTPGYSPAGRAGTADGEATGTWTQLT